MMLRGGGLSFSVYTAFFLLAVPVPVPMAHAGAATSDEAKNASADAFKSAKELGTAEAWNAFLSNYPTGFHADLARAYLKKLTEAPAASPPAPVSTGVAQELGCSERGKVRSLKSDVATKITFINKSGMYRSIEWIDFDGGFKGYGGLNPGEQVTQDTFVSHPWMVATGPGDCLQIFMPDAVPATVDLLRVAADDGPAKEDEEPKKQTQKKKKPPLVCAKNYKLKNGACVLVQNCGSNAYRSAEGDCYCNKNYVMKSGKCVWKTDKQGFEVKPWKKPGCTTWQQQCSAGNNKACGQYEANCQVN